MGTENLRKANIDRIKITIQKATKEGKIVDKKKLITLIALEVGVTAKKSEEYIDLLISAGLVIETEGTLTWNTE